MVSSSTITALIIAALVCFLFPIAFTIFSKIKNKISLKPVFAGVAVFIVFVLILEQILHSVVLKNGLITNPIFLSIYAALAAGVFEEVGRFLAYTTILKEKREWKDGLAYGIGHGGIEAMLIGGLTYLSNLLNSLLINSGAFDSIGSQLSTQQLEQLNTVKQVLIELPEEMIIIGTLERIFAFGIQIALSIVVLYAIKKRKYIYVLLAIILHALVDVPAALYQMKILSLYIVEIMIFVFFIIAVIFTIKSKKLFYDSDLRGTEA